MKQDTGLRERINRQHKHVGTKSEWLKCKVSYNLKGIKGNEKGFINTLEIRETGGQVSSWEEEMSTRQARQKRTEG